MNSRYNKGLREGRTKRLLQLARKSNLQRKQINQQLNTTCAELAAAYRTLSGQMSIQKAVIDYQKELLAAKTDDDVFSLLFRTFVRRSGSVFGIAMVCDADAKLQILGRFGVPYPDSQEFCSALSTPIIDATIVSPQCTLIDAGEDVNMFDQSIRKYLVGLTILAIPLMPHEGEMIGLVLIYRKGEQPFTDDDLALAEMIASPTALAIQNSPPAADQPPTEEEQEE